MLSSRPVSLSQTASVPAASSSTSPSAVDGDPACPYVARPVAFDAIPRAAWDRLLARHRRPRPSVAGPSTAPGGTRTAPRPTSSTWCASTPAPRPARSSMPRPSGPSCRSCIATRSSRATRPRAPRCVTAIRPARPCRPTAKAVFFGASYHADYATILAGSGRPRRRSPRPSSTRSPPGRTSPTVTPTGTSSTCGACATTTRRCRRSRAPSPSQRPRGLARRTRAGGCLPGPDAARRRRLGDLPRRASTRRTATRSGARSVGPRRPADPLPPGRPHARRGRCASSTLHQARWGDDGLFPATDGGDRSRRFLHRLAELELREGAGRQLQLGLFEVAGRVIMAGVGFDDGRRVPTSTTPASTPTRATCHRA